MNELAASKRQPNATLLAIRGMRQELGDHREHDAREFESVRAELRADHASSVKATKALQDDMTTLVKRQAEIATLQRSIADALKVGAKAGEKPQGKPVLLMGRWELLWKVGGGIGGLVLIYRMIWDSWPFIVGIAKVIAHAK